MRTKTVIEMDYDELEDLIRGEFGHEFSVASDLEIGNDSAKTFIFKPEVIDEYDQNKIDGFKKSGKGSYLLRILMQDLVNREVLPAGNYVIEICW